MYSSKEKRHQAKISTASLPKYSLLFPIIEGKNILKCRGEKGTSKC